jgi:hypothetical protein
MSVIDLIDFKHVLRIINGKRPVSHLFKNFLTLYGTRKFITVFARVLNWSLSFYSHLGLPSCIVASCCTRLTFINIK